MSGIEIIPVTGKRDAKAFVQFPKELYKGCAQYVPDFDSDIYEAVRSLNAFVAKDENGKVVGRVATFVNEEANKKWQRKAVRFMQLDFVDDPAVSKALLDRVEAYGREQGMEMVLGPLGLDDFDKEGMLIEGFDRLSSMIEYYNHPYYPQHLEAYGYSKIVDWVHTRMAIPTEVPKTYARVANYAKEAVGLRIKIINKKDISEGYVHTVFHMFNEAYAPIFGFASLPDSRVDEYTEKFLKYLDLTLMPVVVDEKGEIVGACITMPSLSLAVQKTGGRMLPFGWWHLVKAMKFKHEDTLTLLLIGVRPEYQGYGVSAVIFDYLIPVLNKKGFKWAETGPQLEYNSKELSQWKPLNPEVAKRRRCYQKALK
ncbi:MAG: N-acetyltransferase [Bacteroidaceae bacterium]|nr:N-acetyltransferase [Bacteroidaceae bacterium]